MRLAGLLMALLVAACTGGTASLDTTTTMAGGGATTTSEATTTTVAVTTSTALIGQVVTEYEVVARQSGQDGEVLYIVIPPGAYTDVDLQGFLIDLLDAGAVTYGAEVFDAAAAAQAHLKPEGERSAEETGLIEQHHLVSLVEGTLIRFQGPFSSSGEYPIGS